MRLHTNWLVACPNAAILAADEVGRERGW
jgi:hypothetical protein